MPALFRLEKEKFSQEYNEWWWNYSINFNFIFNERTINYITITDHYRQEHPEITNELILNILNQELNNKRAKPTKYQGARKVFVRERIIYQSKKYKLVFWFKGWNC